MIVTFTPNPSIDLTYDLGVLHPGEINRAVDLHQHAGGKGINVARVLIANGVPALAVMPTGSRDGRRLTDLLGEHGVRAVTVPVSGDIRTNVTLAEGNGVTTKINATGPTLTEPEVTAMLAALEEQLRLGPDLLVGAGSLPPGAGTDLFVKIAQLARRHEVPMALDTSGEPLRAAVAAGGLQVVKPNHEELAELCRRPLHTVGEVVQAARGLIATGVAEVLVSLGEHGALLVVADDHWWAGGPPLTPASTVGAGDVTLAGYLAQPGPHPERLARAVAWGRAAVLLPGSEIPRPHHIDVGVVRVIHHPDPHQRLKDIS